MACRVEIPGSGGNRHSAPGRQCRIIQRDQNIRCGRRPHLQRDLASGGNGIHQSRDCGEERGSTSTLGTPEREQVLPDDTTSSLGGGYPPILNRCAAVPHQRGYGAAVQMVDETRTLKEVE